MSLIVKMMSGENESDTDTRKSYVLFSEVYDVTFKRNDEGEPSMELQFAKGYEAIGEVETTSIRTEEFAVTGNVYVMNENGKTISSFGCAPPDNVAKKMIAKQDQNWPLPSFEARDWAQSFIERVKLHGPDFATDEGNMIGWFANALMRGFDEHAHKKAGEEMVCIPAAVATDISNTLDALWGGVRSVHIPSDEMHRAYTLSKKALGARAGQRSG